jgi:hypothetical protein
VGNAYRSALRDLIRQGQERGEIRTDIDPEVEATALFGAIRGSIAQWLFEPDTIDLKQVARALAQTTRRALAVESRQSHPHGRTNRAPRRRPPA